MAESAITIDLKELLANQSVADVEDLPELLTLPAGTYILKGVSMKAGESQANNPKVGVMMEVVEVVSISALEEKNGVTAESVPVGSNTYFNFGDKELAKVLSRLKKPFGETMEENGIGNFGELMDQFDQLSFACEVTRRKAPDFDEDDPKYFGELVLATIA